MRKHLKAWPSHSVIQSVPRYVKLSEPIKWASVFVSMVSNGIQWCQMVPNGTNGTLWHLMVPYGTQWYRMVSNGAEWYRMVPNVTQWC